MRQQRQIVTLVVEFDPRQCPPPEAWDWAEMNAQFSGVATVKVLATGAVERVPELKE